MYRQNRQAYTVFKGEKWTIVQLQWKFEEEHHEKLENAELLALALHRIENGAFSQTKDWGEVRKELGISSEDLADVDDAEVEFE